MIVGKLRSYDNFQELSQPSSKCLLESFSARLVYRKAFSKIILKQLNIGWSSKKLQKLQKLSQPGVIF